MDMNAAPNDAVCFRRPASEVMRLARLGSAHQTRLSFMRSLLRGLRHERWQFDRPLWQIDARGVGRAIYRAIGPQHTYSLVAFAHDLPADQRSDRVIATAWDATFTLFDGEPSEADLTRLAANVPLQEAGRISDTELSLSRANRSVRLWEHVVASLARGGQPEADELDHVGYLMRTTAVYGSGKFGACDRAAILGRGLMAAPFHIEMLSVWLIRAFTLDLVEHLAEVRGGPAAVKLEPALRRRLGVGNSTGLGMAPFLVNHPALLHAWIDARETAIARVRALPLATAEQQSRFHDTLARARLNAARWRTDHPAQRSRCATLHDELARTERHLQAGLLATSHPWDALMRWAGSTLSLEGQEQLAALILEPYPELVDDLALTMQVDEQDSFRIDGAMPVSALRTLLARNYAWASAPDYAVPAACARFWYVSSEKLEPRLGARHAEPGAEYEQPLDVGRAVAGLADGVAAWAQQDEPVSAFLHAHPEHRHTVRRVQLSATRPYAEIRDNMIADDMLPIDIMRCKLSFFGATRFDPRSDRWVRICMFQNAPFPHELAALPDDDWVYPQPTPLAA
jgi:hypothetical protein